MLTLALESIRQFQIQFEWLNTDWSAEKVWNRQGLMSRTDNKKENNSSRKDEYILSRPVHSLSDRDQLVLFEFAFRTNNRRGLLFICRCLQLFDSFWFNVGISPSSADALLLFFSKFSVRFHSLQESNRRISRRGISIDMIIYFTRSLPMDIGTVHKHAGDDGTRVKRATNAASLCDPLRYM